MIKYSNGAIYPGSWLFIKRKIPFSSLLCLSWGNLLDFRMFIFFSRVFKTLQLFCMSSSWSLCLKSTQGGQPVLVKACPTVTPVQPALNPSITFLTWTTRSQSEEKLKSTRPFWKPVREHFRYFCSALRFDFKNINFLIRTDSNHQIKRVIPSTSSENEAFVVYC